MTTSEPEPYESELGHVMCSLGLEPYPYTCQGMGRLVLWHMRQQGLRLEKIPDKPPEEVTI